MEINSIQKGAANTSPDYTATIQSKLLYELALLLLGEKITSLSRKPLKVLFNTNENPRKRKLLIAAMNNSDKVDCVVSVDKYSLGYVHASRRAKWRIIYNFVDLGLFSPSAARPEAHDGRTILVPRNLINKSRGIHHT